MATGAKAMGKSPEAFRTISEVAAQLETPAHVLRFWESKFPQIKPVKRAGGRRYYRPDDIALLGGIKVLLHEKGMTIKGVQNLLREHGSRHVATLYTAVGITETAGGLLAGPLLAASFRTGMDWGGAWIGLPYIAAGGLFTVATIAVTFVVVVSLKSREDTSVAEESQ